VNEFLSDIFGNFGEIENISVSKYRDEDESNDYHNDARFAHVLFKKKSSVKNAMTSSNEYYHNIITTIPGKWGLSNYKKTSKQIFAEHTMHDVDINQLKSEVDNFMREFEEKEQIEIAARKKRSLEADEDGFTLVKKRKKVKRIIAKRGNGTQRDHTKKKSYELKNFYRFQMREERREKLAELRKKFEEDKEKVANMKLNRKFKPF